MADREDDLIFRTMLGKWRCSQCERLNSMDHDNVCPKCFGQALEAPMSDHFQNVVDYVMGEDTSELSKVRAELAYALHSLEREIAIAQQAQAQSEALVEALTDLIEAVRRDSDEDGKGISGYTAARLSDARAALALVG